MTTARRKLSTVLATAAVLTSLWANNIPAAQNDAEDVRNVLAGFATTWNRHATLQAQLVSELQSSAILQRRCYPRLFRPLRYAFVTPCVNLTTRAT
jgi:hypothetical protein